LPEHVAGGAHLLLGSLTDENMATLRSGLGKDVPLVAALPVLASPGIGGDRDGVQQKSPSSEVRLIRALIAAIGIATAGVALATPAAAEPDCVDSCSHDEESGEFQGGDDDGGWAGPGVVGWGVSPYVSVCAGVDTAIPFVGAEVCT
jgi:hypothetical protein